MAEIKRRKKIPLPLFAEQGDGFFGDGGGDAVEVLDLDEVGMEGRSFVTDAILERTSISRQV